MTESHRASLSGAAPPLPRLDALPDEVLTSILLELDARTLIALSLVGRRFQALTKENLIWRTLTLRNFRFWDARHDINSKIKDPTFDDWKGLYAVRHTANVATAACVDSLIHKPIGRLTRMGEILKHGYGIKDALIRLSRGAEGSEVVLAQRFWTEALLGCVNRSLALETWTKIRYRSDIVNPTEMALIALDMFILGSDANGDFQDTFRRLDEMVAALREAYPDIDAQTPRTKAVVVAEFLRRKKWVGIDEGRDFYSMQNQFLGFALRSWHRNSLPLISCVIYSYVCRALGLRAQPCNFPIQVHVVVQPPLPTSEDDPQIDLDGQPLPTGFLENLRRDSGTHIDPSIEDGTEPPSNLTHLYINPFNNHTPISLSALQSQLAFVAPQASSAQKASFLLPTSPRSLLVRSAHNIIESIRSESQPTATNLPPIAAAASALANAHRDSTSARPTPISIYSAAYAALYVLVLFPTNAHALSASLDDLRAHFAHHFSEDLANYEAYILPLTTGLGVFGGSRATQDPLVRDVRAEDERIPDPKRRGDDLEARDLGHERVRHRVGTVFRHRRQGYIAVIYGWDARCEMGERWILVNRVDGLSQGRGQPFYNAYVADKSTRYVAQENVIPLGPEDFTAEDAEGTFDVQVGRWFKRFDAQTARFVSNVLEEYPED